MVRVLVKNDLPTRRDFRLYFGSLNRLINFISRNLNCVDFSMKFGLFLLNVNLRPFTKKRAIPTLLRHHLKRLVDQSNILQDFYKKKLTELKVQQPNYYKIMKMSVSMLNNEAAWSKNIVELNLNLERHTRLPYNHAFPEWAKFELATDDLLRWMPSPNTSVMCLSSLAKNKENFKINVDKPCRIEQECVDMVDYGTNFGYALTFRLGLLLLARLSRGCTIFSLLQDKYIRTQLCVGAYKEAEFIAANAYRKPDLMMEQMSLCSLDGHAQFLRRTWLTHCLQFQTPYGYFSDSIHNQYEKQFDKHQMQMGPDEAEDEKCLKHINPVAVGALSAAIRYILEEHYGR